jgi:hypothetical protein
MGKMMKSLKRDSIIFLLEKIGMTFFTIVPSLRGFVRHEQNDGVSLLKHPFIQNYQSNPNSS